MSGISRRSLLGVFGSLPAARLLCAQTQHSTPVAGYSTTVKVVNLFATVRDKQGRVVTDLTKDDFLLDEGGKPQTIRYFSRETDLPLTLGLLVDTSGSERNVLPDERSASYRFLDTMMRPAKDMAFVIHFDFEVELLQDLTDSKVQLQRALDRLDVRQLQRRGPGRGRRDPGGNDPGSPMPRFGGGTCLYDAVFLGANDVLKNQQGRKALIVLSDGVDNGSRVTLEKAVETAQRSDTLVYSILFEDPDGNRGFGGHGRFGGGRGRDREQVDGHKVLERLSRETGGRYFEVSKKMPIDKVYESLAEELRSQYSIGFTPDSSNTSTDYRRVHLSTREKALSVQAREGYYPS
ncbi:MAG TPA: VWA domain-containing protein [Bryobacteraceae bacterium]|jgi:VWFA-related protein|nr:VWA domain-containing protein [Bryobacteraceae bacterium]